MKTRACLSLTILLSLLAAAPAQQTDDPRPRVLIIGGINTQPFGSSPSWAQHVDTAQPEWRITIDAAEDRTFGTLDSRIDDLLDKHGPQQMVILVPDVADAATEAYAERDAAAVGKALETTLDRIAAHANTGDAQVVLATPFPVVDARLDKWHQAYAGGQQRSVDIAAQVRRIAERRELTLLPLTRFVLEKKDGDGNPGLPMGSLGARLRDWGHTLMAEEFFIPQMSQLEPAAADPEAFAAWKRARRQMTELAHLLHETASGEVRRGEPLDVRVSGEDSQKATVTVPASALDGGTLDLLILPPNGGAIGFDFHMAFNQDHRPTLVVGEQRLPMDLGDWRLIDESRPDAVIPHNEHGLNSGKWRPRGVVWDVPGERRWMLMRIALDKLRDKADGSITFDLVTPGERLTPDGPVHFQPPTEYIKAPQFHIVAPPDDAWEPTSATWTTRDGEIGWTGGKIDQAARTKALKAFLARSDLEPAVRQAAEDELNRLDN